MRRAIILLAAGLAQRVQRRNCPMSRLKKTKSRSTKAPSPRAPKMRRDELRTFSSMADADRADREYWWSRTPAERLRECERLRQWNYGYGQGRPLPRFQSVLRVAELR